MDVLSDLEDALNRTLMVVRNGITHVQQEVTTRKPGVLKPEPTHIETPSTLDTSSEPLPIERISSRRELVVTLSTR